MIHSSEEEMKAKWDLALIYEEIEGQYEDQTLKFVLGSSRPDIQEPDTYVDVQMAFEVPGNDKEYLWVTASIRLVKLVDRDNGYIDEFYEDNRELILGYVNQWP